MVLALIKKTHLYYAINIFDRSGHNKNKYFVLHFNEKGNLKEKILLKSGKESIITEAVFIDSKDIRYGIGKAGKRSILFRF